MIIYITYVIEWILIKVFCLPHVHDDAYPQNEQELMKYELMFFSTVNNI